MIEELVKIPEVEEPEFQEWLKQSIIDTYHTIKDKKDDTILVESYLQQQKLYMHLYHNPVLDYAKYGGINTEIWREIRE